MREPLFPGASAVARPTLYVSSNNARIDSAHVDCVLVRLASSLCAIGLLECWRSNGSVLCAAELYANRKVEDKKVQEIMEMGFSREKARASSWSSPLAQGGPGQRIAAKSALCLCTWALACEPSCAPQPAGLTQLSVTLVLPGRCRAKVRPRC